MPPSNKKTKMSTDIAFQSPSTSDNNESPNRKIPANLPNSALSIDQQTPLHGPPTKSEHDAQQQLYQLYAFPGEAFHGGDYLKKMLNMFARCGPHINNVTVETKDYGVRTELVLVADLRIRFWFITKILKLLQFTARTFVGYRPYSMSWIWVVRLQNSPRTNHPAAVYWFVILFILFLVYSFRYQSINQYATKYLS